ncbi:hypothetical protein JKP88DRAFT_295850 [Tribonema minus]|uniref:Uncharacterized protein n=1 Tax=Tribonema minus TaxID=303371 RepID=A0A835ZIT2_9STRA|nr:hypothetical protein JKP88DRAFT_295850 [Tribonema minus]
MSGTSTGSSPVSVERRRRSPPPPPGEELVAFYRHAAATAAEEETYFRKQIEMVQPSQEERHRIEWQLEALERELAVASGEAASLRASTGTAGAAIAARAAAIAELLAEQREDRTRVQRLLALCQPVSHDVTVLFDHFGASEGPRAAPPLPQPQHSMAISSAAAPPPSAAAAGGGGAVADRRRQQQRSERSSAGTAVAAAAAHPKCTRGYEEHLLRRVALLEAHAEEVESLGRAYLGELAGERERRAAEAARLSDEARAAAEPLRSALQRAAARREAATAAYLRLRHNARVAAAAAREERQRCAAAKEEACVGDVVLQERLAADLKALASGAEHEVETGVKDLRARAAAAERALHDCGAEQQAQRQRREEQLAALTRAIDDLRERHDELAYERADSLPALARAVGNLRRAVAAAEQRSLERALFT